MGSESIVFFEIKTRWRLHVLRMAITFSLYFNEFHARMRYYFTIFKIIRIFISTYIKINPKISATQTTTKHWRRTIEQSTSIYYKCNNYTKKTQPSVTRYSSEFRENILQTKHKRSTSNTPLLALCGRHVRRIAYCVTRRWKRLREKHNTRNCDRNLYIYYWFREKGGFVRLSQFRDSWGSVCARSPQAVFVGKLFACRKG